MRLTTIAAAFAEWQTEYQTSIPRDDGPMNAESWNDYVDSLNKDGALTDLQAHYCPAWDDEMPGDCMDDERDFILDAMRVGLDCKRIEARTGNASEWDKSARHWSATITREGREPFTVEYSQGSAITRNPARDDVLYSVMQDANAADESFDDFCDSMSLDADSRRAYAMWEACKATRDKLAEMFTASELSDLAELFGDF